MGYASSVKQWFSIHREGCKIYVNIAVAFYTNDLPSQGLRVNQLAAKKFLVSRLLLYQICDSEDWGVLIEKYTDMYYRYICKKKYFCQLEGRYSEKMWICKLISYQLRFVNANVSPNGLHLTCRLRTFHDEFPSHSHCSSSDNVAKMRNLCTFYWSIWLLFTSFPNSHTQKKNLVKILAKFCATNTPRNLS